MIKAPPVWHSFVYNVNSRASHPGGEPKTGEDIREGMHFLLAKSGVSGFTRRDEFDLCGCCCCEAPRFDWTIRVRWSHSLARLRHKGRGNVLFRHFNPHRWTGHDGPKGRCALTLRHGLDSLEVGEDYLLPRFTDGNPISKYDIVRF